MVVIVTEASGKATNFLLPIDLLLAEGGALFLVEGDLARARNLELNLVASVALGLGGKLLHGELEATGAILRHESADEHEGGEHEDGEGDDEGEGGSGAGGEDGALEVDPGMVRRWREALGTAIVLDGTSLASVGEQGNCTDKGSAREGFKCTKWTLASCCMDIPDSLCHNRPIVEAVFKGKWPEGAQQPAIFFEHEDDGRGSAGHFSTGYNYTEVGMPLSHLEGDGSREGQLMPLITKSDAGGEGGFVEEGDFVRGEIPRPPRLPRPSRLSGRRGGRGPTSGSSTTTSTSGRGRK